MATLYWSPVTSKNWNVVGNWWTDAGCTAAAANVPWVSGDATYLAYDLARGVISGGVWNATAKTLTPSPSRAFTVNALNGLTVLINGVQYTVSSNTATVITMSASGSVASGTYAWSIQSVTLNATILATAAGSCSLTVTSSSGTIYGGTFTGTSFTNNSGTIYGGTFTGTSFTNNIGSIYGGTFTGASFSNDDGTIYGGTFTGASFTNDSNINGGTFTGASFTNDDGTIYGGTFTGASFSNDSNINGGTFTGASFSNIGSIYGGTFTGASFSNLGSINGGYWWLSGRMKMGANTYTASGDASPSANFTNFYTDNCQLTAAKIVAGNSVTELGTTVNGGLALADILNANTGVAAGGTAAPGGTIIIPI